MSRAWHRPCPDETGRRFSAPSSPVALLELLAAPTPAGVVAADLLAVGSHPLLRRDGSAAAPEGAGVDASSHLGSRDIGFDACGGNCIRAGERLVLVREAVSV